MIHAPINTAPAPVGCSGFKPCPNCGQTFDPAQSTAWGKKHCSLRCEYHAHSSEGLAA
ncbi:hypothetical protein [Vannielia sp. SX4]|uniref:hypothetical protein n=1 Tax=Vannielia sp. SX4 TaxID=3463852 RepID=UPI004058F0A5